jgi:hypothetical protein
MQLSTPNIREVYETTDPAKVNDMLQAGWKVLSVATDPYGESHYTLGLPEQVTVFETRIVPRDPRRDGTVV